MGIDYNFVDPGAIQDAAAGRLTSLQNERARLTAGNAVAAGDYGAGSKALLSSGLLKDGLDLEAQGQARADDTASRTALSDYAAGNYSAAKTGFAKGNNLQGVTAADTGQKAYTAAHLQVMQKLANALDTDHKAGVDPAVSFDKAAPIIANLFPESAKDLPQYRAAFLANPQGVIDTVHQATQKELEAFTLKNGDGSESRFGPNAAKVAEGSPKPVEQKYVAVPEGGKLVPVPTGQPAAEAAPASAKAASALVGQAVPGVTVSSADRTPQRNAEVGGAADSYHLRGQALDLVPPKGMTTAQLHAELKGSGLGFRELLDEGDHVHIAWAPRDAGAKALPQGGDPVGTIYGNPKSKTKEPPSGYTFKDDGTLAFIPGGPADPVTKTGQLKPVPPQIQSGLIKNRAAITQIDEAIALLKANPKAMGLKNALGDNVNQRLDSAGVPVRGAVANIGSLILHDRSGAAVTAAEQPRLMPFIPTPTDTAPTAIQKLQALKHQYENANQETELAYGADSGYRPMGGGEGAAPKAAPALTARPASGPANKPPHKMTDAELKASLGL